GRHQGCAPAREFLGSRYIGKFGAYFAGGGFIPCPFGKPGDALWGKETWALRSGANTMPPQYVVPSRMGYVEPIWYKEDGFQTDPNYTNQLKGRWRSPVSMPRWA